ncbi:N,N'-diacetylchitobiose-specific phosphotransferase enzyme IIA component [Serratia odorifera]|uniref:N,N'-diacetylchitobiose-specific phosphotransferase enzyme IIA component n=1 Tax=Serratia odorifera TaxID=618 RepID=A0A3S5D7G0_SEROD|nr:N,N'-diacetylchitobiose-specific phosphotransferase enzyme IIA component [Serratia odorifera]
MTIDLEQTVMELLINAGEARSHAMVGHSGGSAASVGTGAGGVDRLAGRRARSAQGTNQLIGLDEGVGKIPVNLIMVHAQDHLMTAMLCHDLAQEIVLLRQEVFA